MASTVGLLLVIEAAVQLQFPTTEVRNVPVFLGTSSFHLGGTVVQESQLITFIFAVAVTTVLTVMLVLPALCGRYATRANQEAASAPLPPTSPAVGRG